MSIRKKPITFTVLAVLSAVAIFAIRHFNSPAPQDRPVKAPVGADAPIVAPEDEVHAKYAGSATCRECHEKAFQNWQHSNHGLAERNVEKDEDHKSFIPKRTLTHGEHTSEMFVDADGLAKILTLGLDKKRHAYQPVRVIGNDRSASFSSRHPADACRPAMSRWIPRRTNGSTFMATTTCVNPATGAHGPARA
jgi:hypothetical protein